MKQLIIRMIVVITMCALTSVIPFTSFAVFSSTFQVHAEIIWILRLILASVLSPLLYRFLDKQTARWTIRANHKPSRPSIRTIL
jgi:peptidoglycan/LPS O-acetylase OafA/YrhL